LSFTLFNLHVLLAFFLTRPFFAFDRHVDVDVCVLRNWIWSVGSMSCLHDLGHQDLAF
jgi:hypothetical protein